MKARVRVSRKIEWVPARPRAARAALFPQRRSVLLSSPRCSHPNAQPGLKCLLLKRKLNF